jgi:hypothetical protein
MSEGQHTVVCSFDMRNPKISAFDIHEWIYSTLKLPDDDIRMLQTNGPSRRVYIKFVSYEKINTYLQNIQGSHEYKHANREMSLVEVSPTGLGYRSVRVAGLPPEVKDTLLSSTMMKYGDVQTITEEQWANHCRYKVSNGVRLVQINLKNTFHHKCT